MKYVFALQNGNTSVFQFFFELLNLKKVLYYKYAFVYIYVQSTNKEICHFNTEFNFKHARIAMCLIRAWISILR